MMLQGDVVNIRWTVGEVDSWCAGGSRTSQSSVRLQCGGPWAQMAHGDYRSRKVTGHRTPAAVFDSVCTEGVECRRVSVCQTGK